MKAIVKPSISSLYLWGFGGPHPDAWVLWTTYPSHQTKKHKKLYTWDMPFLQDYDQPAAMGSIQIDDKLNYNRVRNTDA